MTPIRSVIPNEERDLGRTEPLPTRQTNPAAPGLRGNEVPNINRWNAMMVHSSHQELRRQGAGTSPDGEVTSYTRQNVTGSQTRRVAQ